MEWMWIIVVMVLSALSIGVLLYRLFQVRQEYEERKRQLEREHKAKMARLSRLREKGAELPPDLLKRTLSMSYSVAPRFTQYKDPLAEDSKALDQGWKGVGDTIQKVLNAAPHPEECGGMTPDEFEEAIRQNLEKQRKQQ